MELNAKKLLENAGKYPVIFYDSLSLYVVRLREKVEEEEDLGKLKKEVGSVYSYDGRQIIDGVVYYHSELDLIYADSGVAQNRKHSVFGKEGKLILTGYLGVLFFPEAEMIATQNSFKSPKYTFYDLEGNKVFSGPIGSKSGGGNPVKVVNGKYQIFSCVDELDYSVRVFNSTGKIICTVKKHSLETYDLVNNRIDTLFERVKGGDILVPFIFFSYYKGDENNRGSIVVDIDGNVIRKDVREWKVFVDKGLFFLQDFDTKLYEVFDLKTGKRVGDKSYTSIDWSEGKLKGTVREEISS